MHRVIVLLSCILLISSSLTAADFLDKLGLGNRASSAGLATLSQDQLIAGLKEALTKGVQHAVTNLGRTDGFLKDSKVRIPMPESLGKVEKGLRAVGQSELADNFVNTMNRAAEQAVPEAAGVLGESVKQMTVADAKTILAGTNTAATDYFRRTASTNLHARFLPIVKKATEQVGVTSAYKQMTEKANVGGLGAFSGFLGKKEALDIDSYVTSKAMDGLFVKIADQEKLIRANPAARTSDLLQKVFGSVSK